MLRDVVIHIANEQPIIADLLNEPVPSDVALICTNVRTMNGKKPSFIDMSDSTFVFPIAHIRFLEVSSASMEAHAAEAADRMSRLALAAPGHDDELGARALARLGWVSGDAGASPAEDAVVPAEAPATEPAPPNPDDLDPDLMRRIREA